MIRWPIQSQVHSSSSSICLFLSHSKAAGSWGGAFFTVTWPGRKVLGDLTWKKATLALERNENGGANPCPTCAQMYGCLKNYYLLILPWLESPVQICCLVAVSLLSHVFRSSQHRTMLDYVVYIETLSSCQCNQGPNPQDAPSVLHLNVGGLVEWELPTEQIWINVDATDRYGSTNIYNTSVKG